MTLPGITASILPARWTPVIRANVRKSAKDDQAVAMVPAKSLHLQLVQSQIELAWGLVELGDGLRAENKEREAEEALKRARIALVKAENYSRDLKGSEMVVATSSLQILRDAIGPATVCGGEYPDGETKGRNSRNEE